MVYTKHFPIHTIKHLKQSKDYVENAEKTLVDKSNTKESHLDNLFMYIANDDKTISKQLVSGHGIIDVTNASEEFLLTKQTAYYSKGKDLNFDFKTGQIIFNRKDLEKNNAILAHHLIQSFSPDDKLSPEEIHEIGRKTILELTGGEHEFVIATHVDKEHIHNHIVFNSTNMFSGKAYRWQKGTKKIFEQISDKISSKAGAKIIEKSPKNSHKKYTMWQTESIFKSKIKSRLDFLLNHSSDIDDFKKKADALNLSVDFSGKWATYRLLDEPQIKNTRGRNLLKNDPERYNLNRIEEHLKGNEHVLSVEEVVNRYDEKTSVAKNDFDYLVTVESWQISHMTSKGYYLNVDFGAANSGQIFIGAYKVDKLDNGDYNLFLKKNDFFYFMNDKKAERSRYMNGQTLVKQLSLYNGTTPLKKEPVMSTINELVDAINFLAEHGVSNSPQMINLEQKLETAFIEAEEKLSELDEKILQLNQAGKILLASESNDEGYNQENHLIFDQLGLDSDITFSEIQSEISAIKLSRNLLEEKMETTVEQINNLHEIQVIAEKKNEKADAIDI